MGRSTNNVVSPLVVNIDDAALAAGITINHPYPSHLKIVASVLSTGGSLAVSFTGGSPEDGEELMITVVQSSVLAEGLIQRLDMRRIETGDANNPEFLNVEFSDQYNVSPFHEHTTIFKLLALVPVSGTPYYNLLSSACFMRAQSLVAFEVTAGVSGAGEPPQRSMVAMRGPWEKQFTTATAPDLNAQPTNPVYVDREGGVFAGGFVAWLTIVLGSYVLNTRSANGNIGTHSGGATTGGAVLENQTGSNLLVRNGANTPAGEVWFYVESDLEFDLLKFDNAAGKKELTFISQTLGATTTNHGLIKRPQDDNIYGFDNAEFWRYVADLTSRTSILIFAGTPIDVAMSPDGAVAVLTSTNLYIAKRGTGTQLENGDFVTRTPGLTGTEEGIVWDRLRSRWLVFMADGDIVVHASTDVDATAFGSLGDMFTGANNPDKYMAVGNAIVATKSGADEHTFVSYNGGLDWEGWQANIGQGQDDNVEGPRGFTGAHGHLFCTVKTEGACPLLVSVDKVGSWGQMDVDK